MMAVQAGRVRFNKVRFNTMSGSGVAAFLVKKLWEFGVSNNKKLLLAIR
jgi:hypothetical protein